MNDANLKKMRPHLWIFAALLLIFDLISCTREVLGLAQRGFHWGWWSWTPCFYNIFLLTEVILSRNKNALIASCVLLFLEFAADICLLLGWNGTGGMELPYALLYLAGMIALLIAEDNSFLKKLNLVALGITVVGIFSIHL